MVVVVDVHHRIRQAWRVEDSVCDVRMAVLHRSGDHAMSKPITDIDGRDIPPPEPTSDLAAFERLVMFCRRNHIRIGNAPVRIGSIIVQIEDLDLPKGNSIVEPGPWIAAGYEGA